MLSMLVLCGMMPSFAFAEGGGSNETDEPLNINWVCTYPDGTSVPSFGGFNLKPIFPDMEDITGGGVPGTIFDVYVNITKIKSNATVDENGEYTIPLNGLKLKDEDRINFVIPKPDAPDAEPIQQKLFTITVKPVDQNWNPLAEEQFQDMDISGQQGNVNNIRVRPNDNTNVSAFMLGLMQMKGYLNILPNEGQELIGVYNQDKTQLELTEDNDPCYVLLGYKSYKIENLLKGEPRDIVLYAMVKKDKDIDPPSQEEYFTYSDNTKTTITGLTDAGKKMLKDNGGKLVIPKGVREIGYRAFDKTKITSVDIPDSVTSIGKEAFAHNNLTTVNIPNSVTEMGDGAFAVNKLKSVHISEQLVQIKNNVFDDNQITSVIIPDSVISIGEMAFSQNKLTSVNIPKSVQSIGDMAFDYQEGEFHPEKNPFNFKDFGINGEFNVTDYKGLTKDKDGNFSFPKKVDSVVLDFTGKEGKFTGKLTVYNPHKYDNQEKKGITDKTQVNFNIITGSGTLSRDFRYDLGDGNEKEKPQSGEIIGQEINFVSSHRIKANQGCYISEIKKDGKVVFENKDGDRTKTTWKNDVKFSGKLKGSAVIEDITEDDLDVTFPTVTYDVKFKRNLDVFILNSDAIDDLKRSFKDKDNKPYNDYPTMLETDKDILSEIGKTTIEVYTIGPVQAKIFTGTLEDYLNFKHSNISTINNIFKVTSVPKGFLLDKTLIHTIGEGDRQGSLYLATARKGENIITPEADASKTNRWIKDETAPLGKETIKRVKVDKDFQYWDGIEWKNMFEAEGISKDSTDEYYTYIRSWGARKDVTSTKDHGTVYKSDPEKPYGYENKVEGKDGTFKGYLIYPIGKLITGGILTIPQQPEEKIVVEHTPAIDTVITKGTKPETKTVEKDGKKYEVTTTYTLNEETGEITSNVSEKEIAPKEYTVTIHCVDAVTKEKIKDVVKTYKEGTFYGDIIPKIEGYTNRTPVGAIVFPEYPNITEDMEKTESYYKNHTLTLRFIDSDGKEVRPSRTFDSWGSSSLKLVKKGEIYTKPGYPESMVKASKNIYVYSCNIYGGYVFSIEKDLYNGELAEGSVLKWNNTDHTIDIVVQKDEGTQTDLTGKDIEEMQNKLKELEGKVTELNGKITTLEKDNKDLLDKNAELNTELEKVKKEKADLEAKITELNDEITNLVGNIADQKAEISDLTKQVETLNNKIKELEGKIKELNTENQTLKDKIADLEKKIKELEAKSNQCSADDAAKAAELEKVKKELADTKTELEKTKKELDDSKLSDAEKAKKIEELNDKIKDLEKKVSDLTSENAELKDKVAGLEKKVSDLEKEVEKYKTSDAEKAKELEGIKTELEKTKSELEKAKEDLANSEKSDAEKATKIAELEKKISDLEKKVNDLTAENKSLKEKIADLEKKLKDAEEKANKFETSDAEKAKEIDKLKKELEQAKKDIEAGKLSDTEKDKKISELNKKISDLEKKVNDLTNENASLKDENQKLKDKVTTLEKKLKEAEEKANTCTAEDGEKAQELEKIKKELADTKAELEKAKEDLANSEKTIEEKDKKISELEKKVSDLEKKINDMKDKCVNKDFNEVEKKANDLDKKADEVIPNGERDKAKLDEIKSGIEETKKDIEKAKEDAKAGKMSDAEKDKKIEDFNKKLTGLEKQLNELNGGNGSGNGSEGITGGNNGNTGNNGGNGTTGHAVNSGNNSGIGMIGNAPSTGDENGMMLYLFSLILGGVVVVAMRKKAERK